MPLTDGETLSQTIRSKGLRATPARIKTLSLLHQTDYPLTHADVAKHLTTMGFDQGPEGFLAVRIKLTNCVGSFPLGGW